MRRKLSNANLSNCCVNSLNEHTLHARLASLSSLSMNRSRILLILLLFSSVASCSKPVAPSHQLSPFASRIQSALPANWSLEDKGQEVIIGRKEPIVRYPCVAMDVSLFRSPDRLNEYVKTNGVTDIYQIRLRRAPTLDHSEYQRLKAINDQIVVTKSTPIPNRKFFEDDAMRSFDSRYTELPKYYDDSSSIYLETSLGPYECIYPDAVATECESIRRTLDSLFKRYE